MVDEVICVSTGSWYEWDRSVRNLELNFPSGTLFQMYELFKSKENLYELCKSKEERFRSR